jgi:hypothetical protein
MRRHVHVVTPCLEADLDVGGTETALPRQAAPAVSRVVAVRSADGNVRGEAVTMGWGQYDAVRTLTERSNGRC